MRQICRRIYVLGDVTPSLIVTRIRHVHFGDFKSLDYLLLVILSLSMEGS